MSCFLYVYVKEGTLFDQDMHNLMGFMETRVKTSLLILGAD